MSHFTTIVVLSSVATFIASGGYALVPSSLYDKSCNIKGNISYNGGERIYHVPGQHYYSKTRIDLLKGERWFCSEADARAAGWRRAGY